MLLATCAAAQESTTSDGAASALRDEIAAKIQDSSNNVRAEIVGVTSAVRSLHDDLETKIETGAATTQKSVSDLHATMQFSAISTVLVSAASAILSILILIRISHVSGNLAAVLNMPQIPQNTQPQGANPALSAALSRIEDKLNAVTKQSFAKLPQDTPQIPREISDRLSSIEQTLQTLSAKKETQQASHSAGSDPTTAFWPQSVKNLENFPLWQKQLRNSLAEGSEQALGLASALLEFHLHSSDRDLDAEKYAQLADKLGTAAYAFCYSLERISEADRLDIAAALARAVKEDAQIHAPTIEIRAFFTNDRLNTDTMEKVDSGSRLTVQRPLSWLIVEKNGGKERILHRAKVITG